MRHDGGRGEDGERFGVGNPARFVASFGRTLCDDARFGTTSVSNNTVLSELAGGQGHNEPNDYQEAVGRLWSPVVTLLACYSQTTLCLGLLFYTPDARGNQYWKMLKNPPPNRRHYCCTPFPPLKWLLYPFPPPTSQRRYCSPPSRIKTSNWHELSIGMNFQFHLLTTLLLPPAPLPQD